MTPEMKKHLEAVVVAIANEQADDAKSEFSKYLRLKTQSILVGEAEEGDDDKEEKSEDKDEDKEEKSEKKEEKSEKKEEKKEEKKDKKEDKGEEDEEKC